LDWDMLRSLVQILNASGISEIAVEYGDTKIQVKRPTAVYSWRAADGVEESVPEGLEMEETAPVGPVPIVVKAGRVGVFHRRDTAEDFLVAEGQEVDEGQTIGYIESVKLMTEVLAPETGKVSRVLVEDGAAVEYGQPLFELLPAEEEPEEEVER